MNSRAEDPAAAESARSAAAAHRGSGIWRSLDGAIAGGGRTHGKWTSTAPSSESSEPRVRRPASALEPPEERGLQRDEVRLLMSSPAGHSHEQFRDLPAYLAPNDVLVVNRSSTLPAALPAEAPQMGEFLLHLSCRLGGTTWLAEPRLSAAEPGRVPLPHGETLEVAGVPARVLGPYPGIPRLSVVEFASDPTEAIHRAGSPIRYGYLRTRPPLSAYQTVFADTPGSAEMPSAARPFSERMIGELSARGVEIVKIVLHTGVSSLEPDDLVKGELYPEPFAVDSLAAELLNRSLDRGSRIIAVGTTVVKALASAWDGTRFRSRSGMTRLYIKPGTALPPLAGLVTGFHEPEATHLELLRALIGDRLVTEGYDQALAGEYLWHEFGDSHLMLRW